jgi:hypothetical protein
LLLSPVIWVESQAFCSKVRVLSRFGSTCCSFSRMMLGLGMSFCFKLKLSTRNRPMSAWQGISVSKYSACHFSSSSDCWKLSIG